MLDTATKKRIDDCRDILVGKLPDPKAQIEQITIGLIYKFMDDMDKEAVELGGKAKFFSGKYKKYSWDSLFDTKVTASQMLTLYSEAIESMEKNPNIPQLFRDIFNNAYLPYRDPETLKLFLKTIGEFEYTHSEKLGDAFEYLLSVMGSQGDAGQFRTPRHIIDFLVAIVDPGKNDTILDPACGTAGFLISAFKHIKEKNKKGLTPDERKKLIQNFVGYDISPDMVRLSLVNLYLHGFSDPHIYEYDTLSSEERWNESYDVILANPPFMSPKGGIRPHKKFTISSNRSEVLFVDYIAEHLNPKGKAGIIVPEGVIFQSGTAYKALRKMLVEKYLYAVVSLPAGVFNPYSGVKTSMLLMDKEVARKRNEILFVKIDNDGYNLGAQRAAVKGSQLEEAIELAHAFVKTGEHKESLIAHAVPKTEIAKNGDYNLSGERYAVNERFVRTSFDLVELGKLTKLSTGGTPTSSKREYYENGNIKWLVSGDIHQGKIFDCEGRITELGMKESNARYLPENSVLIALNGQGKTRGTVALLKTKATCNQSVVAITPNDGTQLLPDYLYQILRSMYMDIRNLTGHGQRSGLNMPIIRGLKIPLPPLSIQEEIVAEIEGYQKIIDGAKAVVENYKPKIDIDPEWEMVELGELATKITDGTHKTPIYTDKGIPFWRVTDLTKSNDSKKFISREEHTELIKRCNPERGDILYSKNGTIGVAKVIDWDFEFSIFVSLALIKPKHDRIDSKYLECYLNSDAAYFQATARSKSGTVTNLHLIDIKTIQIPLPPIETQYQIVAQIEKEQALVNANKQLIEIFEQKIKDRIAKVWGEEVKPVDEVLPMAAEPKTRYKKVKME
ncbi:MAG TPA: N-6 DNA methylase [Cyclobacteriaceae bacterium]|nr:N-6 DNA methylase [Cyclobacteriaceae bacterium]